MHVAQCVGARGVYVCASLKEEFSLAILEAMATGLVVVAADAGGPATYVDDGDTGFLVAPGDPQRLDGAVHRALARAPASGADLADRLRALVAEWCTIHGTAATLAPVYRSVATAETELRRAAGQIA